MWEIFTQEFTFGIFFVVCLISFLALVIFVVKEFVKHKIYHRRRKIPFDEVIKRYREWKRNKKRREKEEERKRKQ